MCDINFEGHILGFKWYPGGWERIQRDAQQALEMTAEAIRTDLIQAGTVPYAEASPENLSRGVVPGELQGSIFIDREDSARGHVSVVSNTPYARRLYFHPEYNFFRGTNAQAGGMWYEPYISGNRNAWVKKSYEAFLRQKRAS